MTRSSTSAPTSWSTPPACGPTRSAPRRRPSTTHDPAGQGHPHHGAVVEGRQRRRRRAPGPRDKRSVFVVPWGDQAYIGTTDTDYDGPLDDPQCTPEDVDYLLAGVNASTTLELSTADVIGTWAGLRPLVADGPATGRTADLSRRHRMSTSASGMVTVTGGKLTTYREMAADTVDAAVDHLGQIDLPLTRRCRTKRLPLIGAERLRDAAAPRATASPPRACPRPAPRRSVRVRDRRADRHDRCRSEPGRAPRCSLALPGRRRSTPLATRWPPRSTTFSPGAPGLDCGASPPPRALPSRSRADRSRSRLVAGSVSSRGRRVPAITRRRGGGRMSPRPVGRGNLRG